MNFYGLPQPSHLNLLPFTCSDLSGTGERRPPSTLACVSQTRAARFTPRQPTWAVFFPVHTTTGTVLSVIRDAAFGFPLFVVFLAAALFLSARSPVLVLP